MVPNTIIMGQVIPGAELWWISLLLIATGFAAAFAGIAAAVFGCNGSAVGMRLSMLATVMGLTAPLVALFARGGSGVSWNSLLGMIILVSPGVLGLIGVLIALTNRRTR